MNLNPKQEEAKNKIDWPLLIIAWAGSWKTATLTARVNYMINEKNINPSSIMMVTFTNKAAKEMRDRVAKSLWVTPPKNIYSKSNFPLIWTFHSIWIFFLKEMLSKYSSDELNIGLKNDFIIYDESDKLSLLKWIIKDDLLLDEKEYPARKVAFYISNAKNSLISAKAYEKEIDNTMKEIVYKVYIKYEDRLKQNNAIDFDDILIKTLNLISIPEILSIYHEKYKYLMIDEYQDTNMPQYKICSLLAYKYKNLAVVWDDSQSIYSWRWANMSNIINFKKDYPDALIVKLEQNYRSTKNIISWANSVIWNNSSWIKKELWTDNIDWEKINYIEAPDDRIEANTISEIIWKNIDNWKKYTEHLILYRTNAQSRLIEESLMRKGVPYRVVGWQKFYDRKEIKDILAYLRVIHNLDDVVNMKRIINVPSRKIWAKTIEILDNYRDSFNLNYPTILHNIDEVEWIKPAALKSLSEFYNLFVSFCDASKSMQVSDLINYIVKNIWYKEYIKYWLSEEEYESKCSNIDELINVASEYNWIEGREWLSQFLEEVALVTDMDWKDDRPDYVTLMTIHTSKWLEENTVFLTWLEENIFPSFRSVWDNFALEEERRLMYVAMTRAREHLYISRASERFQFWEFVRNRESRFISEIPSEYIETYKLDTTNSFFSSSITVVGTSFESNIPRKTLKPQVNNDLSQFKVWDKVEHHKFWIWTIIDLLWEIASIYFWLNWTKKMNIKIAPVKKLDN